MPEENDWILNGFDIFSQVCGLLYVQQLGHYASRTQFCIVINGITKCMFSGKK
jgi:hypothetical protein